MVNHLSYERIEFTVSKKVIAIEQKNNICSNVFCYESNLVYPVHISDQKFENHFDLLLIADKNKSHYVCIKDSNRLMCKKTKCRTKNTFANIVYRSQILF